MDTATVMPPEWHYFFMPIQMYVICIIANAMILSERDRKKIEGEKLAKWTWGVMNLFILVCYFFVAFYPFLQLPTEYSLETSEEKLILFTMVLHAATLLLMTAFLSGLTTTAISHFTTAISHFTIGEKEKEKDIKQKIKPK